MDEGGHYVFSQTFWDMTPQERDLLARLLSDNLEGLEEAGRSIMTDRSLSSAEELLACIDSVEEERQTTEGLLKKVTDDGASASGHVPAL